MSISTFLTIIQDIALWHLLDFEVYKKLTYSILFQFWKAILNITNFIGFIYLSYFLGRSIRTYESKTKRPLDIREYLIDIVAIILLKFGGAFLIQPKVNKIASEVVENYKNNP